MKSKLNRIYCFDSNCGYEETNHKDKDGWSCPKCKGPIGTEKVKVNGFSFEHRPDFKGPLVKHGDPGIDYAGPKGMEIPIKNEPFDLDEMHGPKLLKQMNIKTIDECVPIEILKGTQNGS